MRFDKLSNFIKPILQLLVLWSDEYGVIVDFIELVEDKLHHLLDFIKLVEDKLHHHLLFFDFSTTSRGTSRRR